MKACMHLRDVTAGATSATTVAPKFSDTLTLFQQGQGGLQILPLYRRGRTKKFPAVTSLKWHSVLDWI